MSPPEVILNLQKILKTIEPSYFTNNYSNKNELLDHIYKKHSELTTIKEIEENKHMIYNYKEKSRHFSIDVDIKLSNIEKTLSSVYEYIHNNNSIVSKKMYFLISMCALEDILIQGQDSSFSINVFGLENEVKNSSYIVRDVLEPLIGLFKKTDMEIVVIDMLVNHRDLIEIINTKSERDGILLNWVNKIPDRLILDYSMDFNDIKKVLHMSDIITYNIKLYEAS